MVNKDLIYRTWGVMVLGEGNFDKGPRPNVVMGLDIWHPCSSNVTFLCMLLLYKTNPH